MLHRFAIVCALAACSKSESTSTASLDRLDTEARVLFAELDVLEATYHMDNASYSSDLSAVHLEPNKIPATCKLVLAPVAAGSAASVPGFTLAPWTSQGFYAVAECDVATYVHTSSDGAVYRKLPGGQVEKLVR